MASILDDVAKLICDRFLKGYLSRVRQNGHIRLGPKQIHDPIWGTISLRPLEVALIDSPLLQRLRHLKQLGVAHWVYPGADHSRFEHSLGVLYQTQQLISAIDRAGLTKYDQPVFNEDDHLMLRVAALMHDVGHPVLSHVSEYALKLDPIILLEVQRERKQVGEKVDISELIAAKIVRSNMFSDLLHVIGVEHAKANLPATSWSTNPAGFADRVAKIILGQSVSNNVPLMHELVSGPYDADKLDYMVRDPKAAGIPSIIDISRLVQKLTVERIDNRELPLTVGRLVPQDTKQAYLFGFPWSGLSVIDELLLGRMMLYAKLYRHPKVAGLEALIQSLLDQVQALVGPPKVIEFIYSILDEQLVLSEREDLLIRLNLTESDVATAEKARAIEVAVDLLRRLRERELLVRAFAFFPGQRATDEDIADGDAASSAYDRLIKHIDDQTKRSAFHGSIVAQVQDIIRLLGFDENILFYRNVSELIVLRVLRPPSQKELRHAWIFPTGGAPRTFEKTNIHKEAWSSSFVSASAKGYVFAPKELALPTFLATEAVIAAEFGVGVPEWMMEETKLSLASLFETKLALRKSGFYKGKPKVIRPRWPRLKMSDVENVVSDFAERFSTVQETVISAVTVDEASQGLSTLKKRAYGWLDQFEKDSDIDCALELLTHARLISRKDVVDGVNLFIASNPDFKSASVISLSKGNDSSQIVQYFAADVGGGLFFYGSIAEAARYCRDGPVLVVDDFCGSGHQWSNLIGSLFGEAELRQAELNEQRSLGLEPEREFLRNRKVAFLYTAGWSAGATVVKSAAQRVGMDALVHIHLTESMLPFADSVLAAEHVQEHAASFLQRAGEIGRTLLEANERDWGQEKIEQRKLGYGNRGMLLFFPYNSPSQTMTCMWAAGEVDGEQWDPLIRRRKKV